MGESIWILVTFIWRVFARIGFLDSQQISDHEIDRITRYTYIVKYFGVRTSEADLEWGTGSAYLPIFCGDVVPDFVWVPRAKRICQIVQIDFEITFSPLLRGTHPLRHRCPHRCQSSVSS